jgi:hypothetical protein
MLEKIESVLRQEKFEIKKDFTFGTVYADMFAFRIGRNFIFPQRDYFFVHNIDSRRIDAALVSKLHKEARDYVSSLFKMPKALRFTVPNIASIFYSEESIHGEIMKIAEQNTRSIVGGEIHQVFAIDYKSGRFYSQGTNTVRASVEGASVKMKLNKIDPQNRAYNIVKKLMNG